ncbi:hypothetical protein [Bacillus sp. FSL R12-0069]|uniref:hypothetical protein n=1 Tax=Bacillus sp. FSL R12-0069 TaxID=2975342 RepID=UPI004046A1E6
MDVAKELILSKDQLVEWRRHFHQYPELSFQEEKTSQVTTQPPFGVFFLILLVSYASHL